MIWLLLIPLWLVLPSHAAPFDARVETEQQPLVSGVIIDARGLAFSPSMGMRLFNEQEEQIYTTPQMNENLDIDAVIALGTALYTGSLEQAQGLTYRIGVQAKVLRAKTIRGGDLVLADPDAEQLLRWDQRDRFLERFAVVVIWDRPADFDDSPIRSKLSPRGVPSAPR